MTDIIAQLVIPSPPIHCLDDVPEPPAKKTALDQMFGGFLTPRAPLKTTRKRAKEEILKYRERASLDLSGDVLQWWRYQWRSSTACSFGKALSVHSCNKCSVRASI